MYFLILVSALAVLRISFRIAQSIRAGLVHPPEEDIEGFWTGDIVANTPRHRELAQHLGTCETCAKKLDRISQNKRPIDRHLIDRRY
ncbi:MAG: hypothetical protein WBA17_07920 [Saprospiraceae bacterium]